MGAIMSNFVKLLAQKEAREGIRYSQRDIAKATNTSPSVVSRWMSGDIEGASLVTVKKFCEFFDCDIGDLITLKRETA
jgi:transcriptional regulator with XRE-family HTH domain